MTHEEAVKKLLTIDRIRRTYEKLLKWDESKTVQENAFNIKTTVGASRVFIHRFSLGFVPAISRNYGPQRKPKRDWRALWDQEKTLRENAESLKIGFNYAAQVANKYGLLYTKKYKDGSRIILQPKDQKRERRLQMEALYSLGMTLEKIGEVFGVTREFVRQVINP